MGRRDELRKQIDSLQAEYDSAEDDELEVWVRNGDGHETRLTGERAARWLARNGYDATDADDSSAGDPLDAKDPKKTAPAKKTAAPAKKTAAPAKKAAAPAVDDDQDDAADVDPEPTSGHRFFR